MKFSAIEKIAFTGLLIFFTLAPGRCMAASTQGPDLSDEANIPLQLALNAKMTEEACQEKYDFVYSSLRPLMLNLTESFGPEGVASQNQVDRAIHQIVLGIKLMCGPNDE